MPWMPLKAKDLKPGMVVTWPGCLPRPMEVLGEPKIDPRHESVSEGPVGVTTYDVFRVIVLMRRPAGQGYPAREMEVAPPVDVQIYADTCVYCNGTGQRPRGGTRLT